MATTSPNAANLYGQQYTQIIANALGGSANLQLLNPFLEWNWTPAPAGQIAAGTYAALSQVPQWSAIGSYAPGLGTVDQAFSTLLNKVNLQVPPAQLQQYQAAQAQVQLTQNQLAADNASSATAYNSYVNTNPPTVPVQSYANWMVSTGWSGTIAGDQAAVAKAQQTLANIVAQQNPQYNTIVAELVPPANFATKAGWSVLQGTGTAQQVLNYNMSPDPFTWATTTAALGQATTTTISMNASTASQALSSSWASGSGGIDFGFFSFGGSGGWSQSSQMNSDMSVSVTMKFAYTRVTCGPDSAWFNGGYLASLTGSGAFTAPVTPTGGTNPAFGAGGILPGYISGMVFAYQPSATITMSSSTYNATQSQFNAAGGVQIGCFGFGGSGGSSSSSFTRTAQNNTYTLTSQDPNPLLIGYLVNTLPVPQT